MSTRPAADTADGAGPLSRALVVVFCALLASAYVPVFRGLLNGWIGASHTSYGFLVPLWSGWLGWKARAAVRQAPRRLEPSALAIVAAGLALVALANARGSLTLATLSLPVVLIGLGRFALGREAFRPLMFPTAFLGFMAPLPPELVPRVSLPLQQLAAWFTDPVLAGLGISASRDGLFIRLDSVIVHIAEGCSGLRFLLVMVVLGAASAGAIERRIGVRLMTFALAVAVALGANLVRVAGTVVLVHLYGAPAAQGLAHGLYGKTVYLLALGAFLLAARGLRPRQTETPTPYRPRSVSPGWS